MFAVTRTALRCSRPRRLLLLPLLVRPPPRTPLLCLGGRRRLLTTDRAAPNATGAAIDSAGGPNVTSASTDDSALSSAVGAGSSDAAHGNAETAPETLLDIETGRSDVTTPENLDTAPGKSDITPGDFPPTITIINSATGAPATITIPTTEESTTTTTAAEESAPPTTTDAATTTTGPTDPPPFVPPPFCPGCGAPSQQTAPNLPGYYNPCRPKSERFTSPKIKTQRKHREEEIYRAALDRLAAALDPTNSGLHQAPPTIDTTPSLPPPPPPPRIPRCARCRLMLNHSTAPPLPSYPTLETLTGLLAASKHRRNHIYHLVDAADLPMSLQPDLRNHLWSNLPRSVTRELTISYVVTRVDLLLRTWQQVSSLMTWMKKTVKDALPEGERVEGRHGGGDEKFWAVSAKRGWGIGDIKSDAKHREGGIWVVGAVNVGKSRLVREVWPEAGRAVMGSMEEAGEFDILPPPADAAADADHPDAPPIPEKKGKKGKKKGGKLEPAGPPASESPHIAPTISHIPGTTAAPIRIVYKTAGRNTTSELIDLPGLSRWIGYGPTGLLPYIRQDKQKFFHMENYIRPNQITIKPGQSLLIAGVIMVTPRIEGDDELVVLAYPFLSLPVHLTSTQKAIRILGERDPEGRKGLKLYQKPVMDEIMVEGTARTSDTVDGMAADPAEPVQAADENLRLTEETTTPMTDETNTTNDLEEDSIDEEHPCEDGAPTSASTEDPDTTDDKNLPPAVLPTHIKSAGVFPLSNDVTGARDLHLDSRSPEALAALPYRILSTDILLSGLGWIELVAQVRKRREEDEGGLKVAVEVYTPNGEGVGQRDTMGAYMMREKAARNAGAGPKKVVRQRQSKKGDKKRRKSEKRDG